MNKSLEQLEPRGTLSGICVECGFDIRSQPVACDVGNGPWGLRQGWGAGVEWGDVRRDPRRLPGSESGMIPPSLPPQLSSGRKSVEVTLE